jgi:hypothetical protein
MLLAEEGTGLLEQDSVPETSAVQLQGDQETTRRSQTQQEAAKLVEALNRKLVGWAKYFCLGPVSNAYRLVEQHAGRRLRQWLCVRHKERAGGNTRFPQKARHQNLGLVPFAVRTSSFPRATA